MNRPAARILWSLLAAVVVLVWVFPVYWMVNSALLPNAKNSATLIDQLNLLFCANQMTAATRNHVTTTLSALPAAATDLERVQTAIQLVISLPDGALQK